MSNQHGMLKHVLPSLPTLFLIIGTVFLMEMTAVSGLPESFAYKIEIQVSGPIGSDSISEEDGRTAIQVDTGSLTGPGGETGSAYATADLATGKLALKVSATTPDDSAQSGIGLNTYQ